MKISLLGGWQSYHRYTNSLTNTQNIKKRGWDRTVPAENEKGEENPVDFLLLLSFLSKINGMLSRHDGHIHGHHNQSGFYFHLSQTANHESAHAKMSLHSTENWLVINLTTCVD